MPDAATQRELRKQLLLMRSATERAELTHAIRAARQSTHFLKNGVPGLALGKGLPLALGLLRRAPLFSPLLSLMLAGARRRPVLRYGMLAAGGALLAWKTYQWLAERRAKEGQLADDADS